MVFCVASPVRAAIQGGTSQDYGNRLLKASEASVGSQFLAFPLPMSHILKGKWQIGVDGGYSAVDAGVLSEKGALASVGATYAFADHWGVYGLAFMNRLEVSGGGRAILVTPFATNIPIDIPEHAEFSDAQGTVQQQGLGVALVYDPLVKNEEGNSLPVYAGLIINNVRFDGVKVDYRMLTGANAGQRGQLDFSESYVFPMPMIGALYSHNISSKWRIVPSILGAFSLSEKPQHGVITGTSPLVFRREGDSGAAGSAEANFRPFVFALGTTVVYRPWGLGVNLGATAFRSLVGKSMYDGVDSVLQLDLSWRFGDYVR